MLVAGQIIPLQIEKPAVGGPMIARAAGQVVLVSGAIPGERVTARVTRVGKGVAYAETVAVDEPSADRREAADPLCGGCLYAHMTNERQRDIKALVIADAFGRIARAPLAAPVAVAASPEEGYRMRARLHRRGRQIGFFREGTHEICDARQTRQLRPETCDILDRLGDALAGPDAAERSELEVAENVDGSEIAIHVHAAPGSRDLGSRLIAPDGVTGLSWSADAGECRVAVGQPYVTDRLEFGRTAALSIRRHVLSFFQGNRFLLRDLVAHVVDQIAPGSSVVDLYAGGGLFAVAAAEVRQARVSAVEGDRIAAEDLVANATAVDGVTAALHQSVEAFVRSAPTGPDVVIADPPRTGMSRDALDGVIRLRPRQMIYVSCDVATLARDARRLLDAGYRIGNMAAFDLFPNTPHVETVVVFEK